MDATSLTETLAEMLLTGAVELDDDLEPIADVLDTVKGLAAPDPNADYSPLILAAAAEARMTPLERYATTADPASDDRHAQLVSKAALAVAALVVLVTMSGGMAFAANGAKPGDLLYGIDRALEAIGIGDGGEAERFEEPLALAGDAPLALSPQRDNADTLAAPSTTTAEQDAPITVQSGTEDEPAPEELSGEGPLSDDPPKEPVEKTEEPSATPGERGTTEEPQPDKPPVSEEKTEPDPVDPPSDLGGAEGEEPKKPPEPVEKDEDPPEADPEEEPAEQPPPGAKTGLQGVIGELRSIVHSNSGSPLADKVEDALAKAETALVELEKEPLDKPAAAGNIVGAIGDLDAAINDGLLEKGYGNQLIDRLAAVADQL